MSSCRCWGGFRPTTNGRHGNRHDRGHGRWPGERTPDGRYPATRMTARRRGTWTPSTRWSSMSLVAEGPLTARPTDAPGDRVPPPARGDLGLRPVARHGPIPPSPIGGRAVGHPGFRATGPAAAPWAHHRRGILAGRPRIPAGTRLSRSGRGPRHGTDGDESCSRFSLRTSGRKAAPQRNTGGGRPSVQALDDRPTVQALDDRRASTTGSRRQPDGGSNETASRPCRELVRPVCGPGPWPTCP